MNQTQILKKIKNLIFYNENFEISLILFIFLLIGTIGDIIISEILFDPKSWWAQFLADFGEVPGYICIYLAILLFTLNNKYNKLWQKLKFLLSSIFLYFVTKDIIISIFILDQTFLLDLFLLLVSIFITTLLTLFLSSQSISSEFSHITLRMAIIFPLFLVQTLKLLWGRVRFRELTTDHSNFTLWFYPQGINGNLSFPSGHVAMAWMVFPIIVLINPKKRKLRFLAKIFVLIWIFLISMSRIVLGAHYLSDVVVSSLIGTQIFHYLTYKSSKKSQGISLQ
ncbi:phosphatase PAP2 family protein [Candidatus Hodarchaeum mangrovi]